MQTDTVSRLKQQCERLCREIDSLPWWALRLRWTLAGAVAAFEHEIKILEEQG